MKKTVLTMGALLALSMTLTACNDHDSNRSAKRRVTQNPVGAPTTPAGSPNAPGETPAAPAPGGAPATPVAAHSAAGYWRGEEVCFPKHDTPSEQECQQFGPNDLTSYEHIADDGKVYGVDSDEAECQLKGSDLICEGKTEGQLTLQDDKLRFSAAANKYSLTFIRVNEANFKAAKEAYALAIAPLRTAIQTLQGKTLVLVSEYHKYVDHEANDTSEETTLAADIPSFDEYTESGKMHRDYNLKKLAFTGGENLSVNDELQTKYSLSYSEDRAEMMIATTAINGVLEEGSFSNFVDSIEIEGNTVKMTYTSNTEGQDEDGTKYHYSSTTIRTYTIQ